MPTPLAVQLWSNPSQHVRAASRRQCYVRFCNAEIHGQSKGQGLVCLWHSRHVVASFCPARLTLALQSTIGSMLHAWQFCLLGHLENKQAGSGVATNAAAKGAAPRRSGAAGHQGPWATAAAQGMLRPRRPLQGQGPAAAGPALTSTQVGCGESNTHGPGGRPQLQGMLPAAVPLLAAPQRGAGSSRAAVQPPSGHGCMAPAGASLGAEQRVGAPAGRAGGRAGGWVRDGGMGRWETLVEHDQEEPRPPPAESAAKATGTRAPPPPRAPAWQGKPRPP